MPAKPQANHKQTTSKPQANHKQTAQLAPRKRNTGSTKNTTRIPAQRPDATGASSDYAKLAHAPNTRHAQRSLQFAMLQGNTETQHAPQAFRS
jgi:predicted DsbA family dithiol-disulfide isomerase